MPTDPEIARLSKTEFLLEHTNSTSTKVFCVSNSEAATLAPTVSFEPLITPAEAGALLGVHAKTALKMARAKLIPAFGLGSIGGSAPLANAYIANQLQSSRQPA